MFVFIRRGALFQVGATVFAPSRGPTLLGGDGRPGPHLLQGSPTVCGFAAERPHGCD